ncbi:hypothetical protein AeMF1_011702 [Aphanomyces euteiches]|nr:hypothetical protein Ae201684P_007696 [Aphanomyces euteiches]KAH9114209.1 hypothetical protein AeMF1_011702 [Aphanomyces euteiches]KAH9157450.1 hypothetical protein AeRB84_000696 [Aphanomyces euteiches]KAH9196939.1 hypothetical protein AeNC1_001095 [Aphanomyces euteiches]
MISTTPLIAFSSSVSLCACAIMLVCFVVFEESRRCGRRILFCLHLTDLVGALAWMLTLAPCIAQPPLHSSTPLLCYIQGYLLQFTTLSSYLWTTCFAFHLYQILLKQNKTPEMYEVRYLCFAWGIPLLILAAFATQQACGFTLIGFGGLPWCWIRSWSEGHWSSDGFMLQMVFFYGPLLIAVVFNLVLFVLVAAKLGSSTTVMSTDLEDKVRHRMMAYIGIFLITSVWGALGRTFQVISPGHELSPVFLTLSAFFSPLQGFLNCIIYGLNRMLRRRLWMGFSRLWTLSKQPAPASAREQRKPLVRHKPNTTRGALTSR